MVIFWNKIIQSDFLLKFGSILVVVVSGCDQALHITVTIIFAGTGPCANLFFLELLFSSILNTINIDMSSFINHRSCETGECLSMHMQTFFKRWSHGQFLGGQWLVATIGNGRNVNETILGINGSLGEPILETEDHSKSFMCFIFKNLCISNLINLDSLKLSVFMTFLGSSIKKNNSKVTCHLKKWKWINLNKGKTSGFTWNKKKPKCPLRQHEFLNTYIQKIYFFAAVMNVHCQITFYSVILIGEAGDIVTNGA